MKFRKIPIVVFIFILLCPLHIDAAKKLYRNTDLHFSIYLPDKWELYETRSPNVKIGAKSPSGILNMNIIIKPLLEDSLSTDEELKAFQKLQISLMESYNNTNLINCGLTEIPFHKILWYLYSIDYKYPDRFFTLNTLVFQIFSNKNFYQISYFSPPEFFEENVKDFVDSVSSFVIEDGWY